MNDDNLLRGVLGQLGQTVKRGAKQVVKIPQELVQDAGGQIGSAPQRPGSEGQAKLNEQQQAQKSGWKSDEDRVKFLRGLYGSVQPSPEASAFAKSDLASADRSADKPEEEKKLLELRQQLHKQVYYDPTFNPVKKQEERPAEKVENEKKQEMQELQQKDAKKPPPLAVVRERNKAEMFRGASG